MIFRLLKSKFSNWSTDFRLCFEESYPRLCPYRIMPNPQNIEGKPCWLHVNTLKSIYGTIFVKPPIFNIIMHSSHALYMTTIDCVVFRICKNQHNTQPKNNSI